MSWLADLIGIRTLLVDGSEQEKRSKLAITAGDGVELAAVDNPVADRIELTITMPAGAGDATSLRGIELDAESFALPEDGEVVTYDSGTNTFVLSAGGGGGSGDATSLQAVPLDATTVGAPNDGDVIVFDAIAGEYKAASPGSLGLPSGSEHDILIYDGADWTSGLIADDNVASNAAIAGTKVVPDFGAQAIVTTGNLTVGASTSFVRSSEDSTGSLASLRKDRSGDKLESGDTIGAWRFQPHDGSGYLITTQLTADVVDPPAAGAVPTRMRLQLGESSATLQSIVESRTDTGDTILRAYESSGAPASVLTLTRVGGITYETATTHTFSLGLTPVAIVGDRQLRVQVESTSGIGWDFGLKSSLHEDGAGAAHLVLEKSRGTASAPGGLSNGDHVGAVWFSPYNADDTAYDLTACMRARVEGVPASGSIPTKIELLAGETFSGLWAVFSGGKDDLAITVNDATGTLGYFLDALTHNAIITGQHITLGGSAPASWQSSNGAVWVDGATTAPSAAESDGAFFWSDASTSELRTHRAGVSDYLAFRTATGLATTGHVRAGNALSIVARNNANGTDRTLLNWASDELAIGDGSHKVVFDGTGATAIDLRVAGVNKVQVLSASLDLQVNNIRWGGGSLSPLINQFQNSVASGTGSLFTIQAQNATGATSTGGKLKLSSGTGTSVHGNVALALGGTDFLTCVAGASPYVRLDGHETATSATAGTNGDVPAQVVGYLRMSLGGTRIKVPYYAD